MTNILIISRPTDAHAAAVHWALRQAGLEPAIWFASEFPVGQSVSCRVGAAGLACSAREDRPIWRDWDFDTIWLRRFAAPVLEGVIAPIDRPFAELESDTFLRSLLNVHSDRGRWVNPLFAKERAQQKVGQLASAVAAGLLVPETLVTNDRDEALEFLDTRGGAVVAKQFNPIEWKTADGFATVRTRRVTRAMVEAWRPVELAPTIFQDAVAKAYEVRITMIGDEAVGARLDVFGAGAGSTDWRMARVSGQALEVRPWEVSEPLSTRLGALMKSLGLVFGCIDGIVTPDGEFYFLEVNEMGQFLWLDERCAELGLLGRFCSFLAEGTTDRQGDFPAYAAYGPSGHWADWRSSAEANYRLPRTRYVGDEAAA
jgi:glutathione synthase/RimK-type ligase-like ATP-grasp enzyme